MTDMRALTPSEICRTAFLAVNSRKTSPFCNTMPDRDANEMCPYCKNENTEIVRDPAYLRDFDAFYAGVAAAKGLAAVDFTVMHCDACWAVWSFCRMDP